MFLLTVRSILNLINHDKPKSSDINLELHAALRFQRGSLRSALSLASPENAEATVHSRPHDWIETCKIHAFADAMLKTLDLRQPEALKFILRTRMKVMKMMSCKKWQEMARDGNRPYDPCWSLSKARFRGSGLRRPRVRIPQNADVKAWIPKDLVDLASSSPSKSSAFS